MIYLASPYSHPEPAVREERYKMNVHFAGKLITSGFHVYSPIIHMHPIAKEHQLPMDWEYWEAHDTLLISSCSHVAVLQLPGWLLSKGVNAEVGIAKELNKPVHYFRSETFQRLVQLLKSI